MAALTLLLALAAAAHVATSHAYSVPVSSKDVSQQACSGMWAGKDTHVQLNFTQGQGQVALVIYEWSDVDYLGVENPSLVTGDPEDYLWIPKTYICTTDALRQKLCTADELGEFIVHLSPSASSSTTDAEAGGGNVTREGLSVFTEGLKFDTALTGRRGESAAVERRQAGSSSSSSSTTSTGPASTTTTKAAKATPSVGHDEQVLEGEKEAGTVVYKAGDLVEYKVEKTGYYCVGIVPVTLLPSTSSASAEHASFEGQVIFHNTFTGELSAADYPKIGWYLFLTAVYLLAGLGWGGLCWRYRAELLPIQHYISAVLGYLTVEMFVTFVYYRYLNAHGSGTASTAFLVVVSVLNAGRNSISFFLLLVVSMGLSVVTPTLGSIMRKIQALTVAHFIFGVIYSLGTVSVEIETASLFGLLAIVVGLSLSLTTFLMWTAVSLNGTILHLEKRKQREKLKMFKRLYRILMGAVCAIGGFFVISAIALSDRSSDDFAPRNWQYRWFLLDGSLSTIYAVVFFGIGWLWRPTGRNLRFAMSDEIAQDEDEADADDFELARRDSEDDVEHSGGSEERAPPGYDVPSSSAREAEVARKESEVVFAIDDDDDEEEEQGEEKDGEGEKERYGRKSGSGEEERLVGGSSRRDD